MIDAPELFNPRTEDLDRSSYVSQRIPLNTINVLPQPRKTFEEIYNLAQNIARRGLIHPLTVAEFRPSGCQEYIELTNELWKANTKLQLLKTSTVDSNTFYILIAGERRFRACAFLQENGCSDCMEDEYPASCYERHFQDLSVDVRLCKNIDPIEALDIQGSENIHQSVPPAEEAQFYSEYFSIRKKLAEQKGLRYSLQQFARDQGRSPDTIRNAIRFCELPDSIQQLTKAAKISYGIASELARLKSSLNLSESELERWTNKAIAGEYKVVNFRNMVTNYIRECQSPQTMMELFSSAQESAMQRQQIRKVAGERVVKGVWGNLHYTKIIRELLETGQLGLPDSPYSGKSPSRVYRALIQELEGLLPHLRLLLREHPENSERIIQEAGQIFEQLEDTAIDNDGYDQLPLNITSI